MFLCIFHPVCNSAGNPVQWRSKWSPFIPSLKLSVCPPLFCHRLFLPHFYFQVWLKVIIFPSVAAQDPSSALNVFTVCLYITCILYICLHCTYIHIKLQEHYLSEWTNRNTPYFSFFQWPLLSNWLLFFLKKFMWLVLFWLNVLTFSFHSHVFPSHDLRWTVGSPELHVF